MIADLLLACTLSVSARHIPWCWKKNFCIFKITELRFQCRSINPSLKSSSIQCMHGGDKAMENIDQDVLERSLILLSLVHFQRISC